MWRGLIALAQFFTSDALEVVERFGAVVAAVMRFASGGAKQADQFSGLAFAFGTPDCGCFARECPFVGGLSWRSDAVSFELVLGCL